eukprot:NODE_2_length_91304_cov_0.692462.p1 type:complete len:1976 gc:universal NODE_2_length_91304_cov_0.692462:80692-74765(-)
MRRSEFFIINFNFSNFAMSHAQLNFHTIAGQPNAKSYSLSSNNELIYASGSSVILYKCDYKIEYVQTIPAETLGNTSFQLISSIAAIKDYFFISYGNSIAMITMTGELVKKIQLDSEVHSLCCSNERLFAGSDEFGVYDFQLSRLFSMKMPFPIHLLECSKDGKFIVSGGAQDHLLKVWRLKHHLLRNKRIDYSFIYLKHPQPVLHIEWRDDQHILLTNCMDNTTRIYQEDDNRLVLSCLIEPSKFSDISKEDFVSLHWLNKSVLEKMVDTSKVKHLTATKQQDEISFMNQNLPNPALIMDESLHYWQQKVRLMLNEHPVLVFGVSKNGEFLLWSLQNMQTKPRSIAKVVPLMKIPDAFEKYEHDPDYHYFFSSVYTFHTMPPVVLDEEMSPYKLYMIAQNLRNGHIHIYFLDFIDAFMRQSPNRKVALIAKFQGHLLQENVESFGFTRHPDQLYPYVLSYRDTDVILWKVVTHQIGRDIHEPLEEIDKIAIDHKFNPKNLRWIVSDPAFILVSLFKIYFFRIKFKDNKEYLEMTAKCYVPIDYNNHLFFMSPPSTTVENLNLELILFNENVLETGQLTLSDDKLKFEIQSSVTFESDYLMRIFLSPSILHLKYKAKMAISNLKSKALFISLSKDKLLIFHVDSEIHVLSELNIKDYLSGGRILMIKCSPKHIAIVVSKSNICEVLIFGASILDKRIILLSTFTFSNVCDIDWISCTNESDVLAVLTNDELVIVCQYKSQQTYNVLQYDYRVFSRLPLNQTYDRLTWLQNGGVCLMKQQRLCIIDSDSIVPVNCVQQGDKFSPNILEFIVDNIKYLPDYHPNIIIQYLMWMKLHIVESILIRLYYHFLHGGAFPPTTYSQIIEQQNQVRFSLTTDITAMTDYTDEMQTYLISKLESNCLQYLTSIDHIMLKGIVISFKQLKHAQHSVDSFAFRYLVILRLQEYINLQKAQILEIEPNYNFNQSLGELAYFAFCSESKENLINLLSQELSWAKFSQYQMIHFVNDKSTIEKVAKQEYIKQQDPTFSMILYLALQKKNICLALWKQQHSHPEKEKLVKFLSLDFTDVKNQTIACKNAFVLLGKQKYHMAASFFLLGNAVEECLNICTNHLSDFQLSLTICFLLNRQDLADKIYKELSSSADLFLASMASWKLKKFDQSFALLKSTENDASAFIIACQLKTKLKNEHFMDLDFNLKQLINQVVNTYKRLSSPILSLVAIHEYDLSTTGIDLLDEWSELSKQVLAISWIPILIDSVVAFTEMVENENILAESYKDSLGKSLDELSMNLSIDHSILDELMLWYCINDRAFALFFDLISSKNPETLAYFENELILYCNLLIDLNIRQNNPIELQQYLHENSINLLKTAMDCSDQSNFTCIPQLILTGVVVLVESGIHLKKYCPVALALNCLPTLFALLKEEVCCKDVLHQLIKSLKQPFHEDVFPDTVSGEQSKICGDLFIYRYLLHEIILFHGEYQLDIGFQNYCSDAIIQPLLIKCSSLEEKLYLLWDEKDLIEFRNNLQSTSQEDVWDLCFEWAKMQGLVKNLLSKKEAKQPKTNVIVEADDNYVEDLVKLGASIFASALNVVNENEMVMATSKGLWEIDINYAWCCYKDVDTDNASMASKSSQNNSESKNSEIFSSVPKNTFEESLTQMSSQAELEEYTGQHPPATLPRNNSFLNNVGFHRAMPQFVKKSGDASSMSDHFINDIVKLSRPLLTKDIAPNPKYKIYACDYTSEDTKKIGVFQFGLTKTMIEFPIENIPVVRVSFDPFGEKFGSLGSDGTLYLFDLIHGTTPVLKNQMKYKTSSDFCFLNSGSLLATSGMYSSSNGKVSIYDSLLPHSTAEIDTFNVSEHCIHRIAYSAAYNHLISVGKKGEITTIDLRQRKVIDTFHAHNSSINTVWVAPELNSFFTGSVEGSLKQFTLTDRSMISNYKKIHGSKFLGNTETSGLSSICSSKLNIYTTGYDGFVRYIRKSNLRRQLSE